MQIPTSLKKPAGTQFYRYVRDLHLYFGLFISPFVLTFAISVFYLNHPSGSVLAPNAKDQPVRTVDNIDVPAEFRDAKPAERVQMAREVMGHLGVTGEVGFIRKLDSPDRFEFQVIKPAQTTMIELDLAARSATVREADTGIPGMLVYLHKSPGPHNAAIRGNWVYTGWWRTAVDGIVYLLLFVSTSGVYLWAVLKSERRLGLALLGAGVVSFVAVVVRLSRL